MFIDEITHSRHIKEPSLEGRSKSAIMGLGKESYLLNPADDELDPGTLFMEEGIPKKSHA